MAARGGRHVVISFALMIVVMGMAAYALRRILAGVDIHDVTSALAHLPHRRIMLAGLLAVASYTVLTGYDVIALRTIGKTVGWRRAAMASLISFNFSHNFGFALLTAGLARMKIYAPVGLNTRDVTRLTIMTGVSFWLGVFLTGGFCLVVIPDVGFVSRFGIDRHLQIALGLAVLALNVGYLVVLDRRKSEVGVGRWSIPLPSMRMGALQYGLSLADMLFSAGILAMLIPEAHAGDYPAILVAYVSAFTATMLAHTPGGAGVLETVVLLMLPDLPKVDVLAGILAFRFVYHIVPLLVSVTLFVGHEMHVRRKRTA